MAKHRSNTTGKSGNDSGARRREAKGDPGRPGRGKHPAPKIFSAPQSDKKARRRVTAAYSSRQSNQG